MRDCKKIRLISAGLLAGVLAANLSWEGAAAKELSGALVDPALALSQVTSSTITGRVFGSDGRPVRSATVSLTSPTGLRRVVQTSSLGIYTFTDVVPQRKHVLQVSSKRYRFTPVEITPTESQVTIDFTGQE